MAEESPYVRLVGSAPEQFNMQHLEQRLYREFTEHEISRAQLEEQARPLYQQLTEQAGQGAAENDVRALRERDYNLAQPSLEAPDPASTPPEMLYVRSVGATRTPPYDWRWTWEAHNGDANGSTRSADKTPGG